MTTNSWFVALATVVILALMVVVSTIGLSVGKWVHNVGGILMLVIFGALLLLPVLNLATGHLHEFHPLRTSVPAFSLYNLNILGKLGFGALGGFEYMAILAGETRSPAKAIGRSVWIAAPVIAIMFVLGTSTVVAFVPTDDIDLVGPLPQVLRVGFGPFGIASQLVTIAILMTLAHPSRADERELHRHHAAADGRRMGSTAAVLVHTTAREVSDAGELDRPRRRDVARDRAAESHRRRTGRVVPAAVQRRRNVLRAHLCRDVRDSAVRAARDGDAAAAVASRRVAVRIYS